MLQNKAPTDPPDTIDCRGRVPGHLKEKTADLALRSLGHASHHVPV